jgi:hypothetical protein
MRHLSRDAHFTVETLKRGGVIRQTGGQKLQSNFLLESQVFRAINLAHPSASKRADNSVSACDECAGDKSARTRPSRAARGI